MSLKKEYSFFVSHLDEWLCQHEGTFVLLKGDQLVGFFATQSDAIRAGTQMFGSSPFFVHEIGPLQATGIS